ncbi:MAG: hypothetical protein U9R32_11015 [Bacteroidota bacterium]|nr:hypothetical protein [Bacteroidota bacterium]
MKNKYYQNLIDKYIEDRLSSKEKAQVEKLRKENLDFARELRLETELIKSLSDEDMLDYRRKLKVIISRERVIARRSSILLGRTIRYAASIVLVIALGGTLYLTVPYFHLDKGVFNKYYTTEPVNISRSSNVNIVEAMKLYQQEDYVLAIEYFKDMAKKDKSNIAVRFYLGISYIETEKYANAIDVFEYIISHRDNLYVEHAEWYMGLCYLEDNKPEKALNQFMIIAKKDNNIYHEKAKKIIKKISKK